MKKCFEKIKYLLPLIGSFLASLGGQGIKEWRRVLLPIILSIFGVLNIGWQGILLGTFGIWTAIGYGIQDPNYPNDPNADSGSVLGRFWYNIFGIKYRTLTDIFTRGTVGLGMCLSGLVLPIFKGNWMMYAIGCLSIMIGQTVFSYKGWGEVPFLGKKLLVSDLINYGLIFTGYLLMLI